MARPGSRILTVGPSDVDARSVKTIHVDTPDGFRLISGDIGEGLVVSPVCRDSFLLESFRVLASEIVLTVQNVSDCKVPFMGLLVGTAVDAPTVPLERARASARKTLELQLRVLELRKRYLDAARAAGWSGSPIIAMLEEHAADLWKAVYQPRPLNPAGEASVGPERGSARPCSASSPSERPPGAGGPVSEANEGGQDPVTVPAPPPESVGSELEWLLAEVGIDRLEVMRRMCARLTRGELWHRLVAGGLLNDDQVLIVMVVLVQELMASVGHLRARNVRVSYHLELRDDLNTKGRDDE